MWFTTQSRIVPLGLFFQLGDNYFVKKTLNTFKHYIRSHNYSKIIDTLIIFSGLILVVAGSYLIYSFNGSEVNVGNLEPIAKVERVYLSPKRKVDGALTWGSIGKGQILYRGDQVVTDDLSNVDIKFDDNTALNIPSSSLVKIDYRKDGIHLELIRGLVNLSLKGMKSKIFLKKGNKSYQLDGKNGNVEIRKNGDKLEFSSDKGNLKVLEVADGKSRTLKISKKIVKFIFPEGRTILSPIKDKDVLISVQGIENNNDYIISILNNTSKQKSKLKLKGSKLISGYRFPFSSSGLHKVSLDEVKGVKTKVLKETSFRVSVYPKIVFTAASKQKNRTVLMGTLIRYEWAPIGQESYVIEINNSDKKYRKTLAKPSFTINPKNSSLVEYRARLNRPGAPWTGWVKQFVNLDVAYNRNDELTKDEIFLDSEQRFLSLMKKPQEAVIFELAKSKDFKKIAFRKLVSIERTIVPKNLSPGQYYWRARENKKSFKSSKIYPVKLTAYAVQYSARQKTTYVTTKKKNHEITIRWRERLNKASYKIGLRKKGEEKPFKVLNASNRLVNLTLPELGQYEVLLVPSNHKDFLKANKPLAISVMLPVLNANLNPKDIVLKRSNKLGLSKHYMKLPRLNKKLHKRLLVTIYADKEATKRVFSTATRKPYVIWKTKKSGLFYYKLRVEDKWGRISQYTKPKSLLFPISPNFVTAMRIPAGKKRYYKFPYISKRGDDLATILRNFTKPSTVLSNRSPMVQKIMGSNRHIKNWNKIKPGKKITVFVNADVLDKSFLYVYKKLFVFKD